MKITMYIIVYYILSIFIVSAQNPCSITGQNCQYWIPGGETMVTIDGCPITVNFSYLECNGITYFKLTSTSLYDDTQECRDLLDRKLLPNGWGSNADPIALREIWIEAFSQLIWIWFGYYHQQNPDSYLCPTTYTYKTISPGGCGTARYASKQVAPSARLYRFIIVPCEENGCCINEIHVCWDIQLNQMVIVQEISQVITEGDCPSKEPLYNPFEGYGPEWNVSPPQPCIELCWWD